MKTASLLRIVPPPPQSPHGYQKTQGTSVLTESGERIGGITKITIVAIPNDLYRATIECNVYMDPVNALTKVYVKNISWWRRLLIRMAGGYVETTNIYSESVEYTRP
jgi:hypothetical protein